LLLLFWFCGGDQIVPGALQAPFIALILEPRRIPLRLSRDPAMQIQPCMHELDRGRKKYRYKKLLEIMQQSRAKVQQGRRNGRQTE
jgi:hypothetical protein